MPDGPRGGGGQWGRILLYLTIAHFLTDFTQGSVPVLGAFMYEQEGWSFARVGTLTMMISIASAVLQPLAGIYSDRAADGIMIPVGLIAAGAGLAGAAFAGSYPVLLIMVALCGVGVALFHPDSMRAAHFASGRRRATGMARFQVGGNAGYGLAPAAAVFGMSIFGIRGLLIIALPAIGWGIFMLAQMGGIRALWDAPARDEAAAEADGLPRGAAPAESAPAAGGRNRWGAQLLVLGIVSLRTFFQFSIVTFLPVLYSILTGEESSTGGYLLTVYLVAGALGTVVGGPLADRYGVKPVLVITLALLAPLHLIMLQVEGLWMPIVLAVQGFVLVSTFVMTVVLSQNYLPDNLALASGLNVGIGIGMGGIGAYLSGLAADTFGLVPALRMLALLPVAAAIMGALLPRPEEDYEGIPAGTPSRS